ncbi:hypothetical protein [Vibrio parahaemolyticus]|uniref:hypothetical protein n=1 Tax=Vibrio parahaemolyticus TaxID=670 RepID=UPI000B51E113|nr:hypothetical protein [Vibrio parahaemolyticus]EGR2972440.1 hypothetical protein [Vibrio parahaemolyticus]EGR3062204.1 hypothetical protein [Vibrio parahaemolyticus]EGR3071850.1 hypothetical protein [Vibrio parahaemolyticus]EGR3171324.1 hypothetical protein [Vibrio parahaemolyticus]EGR9043520.1 hypothetical protein [Vibrio parahaemolyticus]
MCLSSGPSEPTPLPKAPPPIQMQDEAAKQASQAERKRRRSTSGYQSTVLAEPQSQTGRPALKTELGG